MAVVPPRQVAVLSVAGYDRICEEHGSAYGDATIEALRAMAISCGVDEGYMRRVQGNTLLLRLDELPREDFLQAIGCMAKKARSFCVPGYPHAQVTVRVGAMSERALRALVNDAAFKLVSYMNHTDCQSAFLTGDELDIWQRLEAADIQFLSYEQLKYLDSFTGLLTDERFFSLLQYLLDDHETYDEEMALLYFDIDDFKSYNRTFSHAEGDRLLLFVAQQLREAFPTDVVAHLHIDRFAVLTNSPDVVGKCAAIHSAVREFKPSFAPEIKCGVIELDGEVLNCHIALDCAKLACESIKGRYDVVYNFFSDELKERLFTRRYVARHAAQAVSEGWIRAFAQPVIDTLTGDLCGFEALARWNDPERGLLSPAVFIPTLEHAHLIHKLDVCVVEAVCRHMAQRMELGLPIAPASVNLSRLDFGVCDIFDLICQACDRYGIAHHLLSIEITESALQHGASLRAEMDRFRAAGFEVWMDDFGCGYSSLNLLKDYDFDVLKVDMEFLRDMEHNVRSKKILLSVLEMARSLGIRTLVEGVETPEQRDFLVEAGCDMMQGYLFGRPAPLDAATDL